MKLESLFEARYAGDHPIVKWMKGAFEHKRDIFYTLTGADDFYSAREAIHAYLGEPDDVLQDAFMWRVTNEYGNFYVDLQKLMGPPKDQEHRLSVTYRD